MAVNKDFTCDVCKHPAKEGCTLVFDNDISGSHTGPGFCVRSKALPELTDLTVDHAPDPMHICSECQGKIVASIGGDFGAARYTMGKAFEDDRDLRKSYKANIAMAIDDEISVGHEKRNELAEKLIKLIWG